MAFPNPSPTNMFTFLLIVASLIAGISASVPSFSHSNLSSTFTTSIPGVPCIALWSNGLAFCSTSSIIPTDSTLTQVAMPTTSFTFSASTVSLSLASTAPITTSNLMTMATPGTPSTLEGTTTLSLHATATVTSPAVLVTSTHTSTAFVSPITSSTPSVITVMTTKTSRGSKSLNIPKMWLILAFCLMVLRVSGLSDNSTTTSHTFSPVTAAPTRSVIICTVPLLGVQGCNSIPTTFHLPTVSHNQPSTIVVATMLPSRSITYSTSPDVATVTDVATTSLNLWAITYVMTTGSTAGLSTPLAVHSASFVQGTPSTSGSSRSISIPKIFLVLPHLLSVVFGSVSTSCSGESTLTTESRTTIHTTPCATGPLPKDGIPTCRDFLNTIPASTLVVSITTTVSCTTLSSSTIGHSPGTTAISVSSTSTSAASSQTLSTSTSSSASNSSSSSSSIMATTPHIVATTTHIVAGTSSTATMTSGSKKSSKIPSLLLGLTCIFMFLSMISALDLSIVKSAAITTALPIATDPAKGAGQEPSRHYTDQDLSFQGQIAFLTGFTLRALLLTVLLIPILAAFGPPSGRPAAEWNPRNLRVALIFLALLVTAAHLFEAASAHDVPTDACIYGAYPGSPACGEPVLVVPSASRQTPSMLASASVSHLPASGYSIQTIVPTRSVTALAADIIPTLHPCDFDHPSDLPGCFGQTPIAPSGRPTGPITTVTATTPSDSKDYGQQSPNAPVRPTGDGGSLPLRPTGTNGANIIAGAMGLVIYAALLAAVTVAMF